MWRNDAIGSKRPLLGYIDFAFSPLFLLFFSLPLQNAMGNVVIDASWVTERHAHHCAVIEEELAELEVLRKTRSLEQPKSRVAQQQQQLPPPSPSPRTEDPMVQSASAPEPPTTTEAVPSE